MQKHRKPDEEETPASRLNVLRAAVLGANDGIVSVTGPIIGVSAASGSKALVLTAGLSALIAGATSMGLGEYVSVASLRDAALAMIRRQEPGIDMGDVANPWQAALSSAVSFVLGALLPFIAALVAPEGWRLAVVAASVTAALAATGVASAHRSQVDWLRPTMRVLIGGLLAMGLTYVVGRLIG